MPTDLFESENALNLSEDLTRQQHQKLPQFRVRAHYNLKSVYVNFFGNRATHYKMIQCKLQMVLYNILKRIMCL